MPIRASQKKKYPRDWAIISDRIRFERASGLCECEGECGEHYGERCGAPHNQTVCRQKDKPWLWATWNSIGEGRVDDPALYSEKPIKLILTVAHLDHDPANCDDGNLTAMCQRCHLLYDKDEHVRNARETRRSRKAIGDFFK